MKEETVEITKKKYDKLIQASDKLNGLEAGGVDNWGGYSESLKEYNKKYNPEWYEDEDEEFLKKLTDVC